MQELRAASFSSFLVSVRLVVLVCSPKGEDQRRADFEQGNSGGLLYPREPGESRKRVAAEIGRRKVGTQEKFARSIKIHLIQMLQKISECL